MDDGRSRAEIKSSKVRFGTEMKKNGENRKEY